MGKKKSKSMTGIKKFAVRNKLVLAALGGAAAGVAIARLLGTEKAAEILNTVEGNVREFGHKVSAGLQNNKPIEQGF